MCDGTTQLCIIRVIWTSCVPLISFPSESKKQNIRIRHKMVKTFMVTKMLLCCYSGATVFIGDLKSNEPSFKSMSVLPFIRMAWNAP